MSKAPTQQEQQKQQQQQQQQPDAKSGAPSEKSSLRDATCSNFVPFLQLMLKLRARRAIFLIIPVSLAMSAVYLPLLSSAMDRESSDKSYSAGDDLQFYGTSDFQSLGHRVLLDAAAFPAEAENLASIMELRGATSTQWMKECASDTECRAEFISDTDASVIGLIRYAKEASKRATLDCKWMRDSSPRCAYVHQLMAQSICESCMEADRAFGEVQFFTLKVDMDKKVQLQGLQNPMEDSGSGSWSPPKSVSSTCSLMPEKSSKYYLQEYITYSVGLSTAGMCFYLTLSALACIRSLRTNGFLQHLFRSGLSPGLYWTVTWLITLPECVLLSAVYTLSFVIKCPGSIASDSLMNVFWYFCLYFVILAAVAFLLELLIPPMIFISMLLFAAAIAHFMWFATTKDNEGGDEKAESSQASLMFPTLSARFYVETYMMSGVKPSGQHNVSFADPLVTRQSRMSSIQSSMWLFLLFTVSLTPYLDFLLRSGNGMCLPAYFPLSCRFWRPRLSPPVKNSEEAKDKADDKEAHIETVTGLSPSIVVDRVSKSYRTTACFGARINVLNGLSCRIYRSHITALIGHNGAGKSTLIKILTGEESPDSGAAQVDGFNATDPLDRLSLRGRISICPQFDALCGDLTVMESIQVTINCKGVCGSAELDRARVMLNRLGLAGKEDVKATDLSGGQKRKVNTILALLGDTKVVFLDEPTSGLDPVSRRQLWQLLQEEKLGRSIVLCTQFMDEADMLADRKIFLCGGQIVCAGSSMFLKRAFGCNPTLNVSLRSKTDAAALIISLKQARLKSQFETELQLEVPAAALIQAVRVLESNQEILAFGLSEATLDDIFMKLSGVNSDEIIQAFKSDQLSKFLYSDKRPATKTDVADLAQSLSQSEKVNPGIGQQFCALLCTNLKRQVRTKSAICNRFLMPLVLLAGLAVATAKLMDIHREQRKTFASGTSESLIVNGASKENSIIYSLNAGHPGFNPVCVSDEPGLSSIWDTCYKITNSPLNKSHSQSIRSFLLEKSTIKKLTFICKGSCTVFYASSWDRNVSNMDRNVSIGYFTEKSDSDDSMHPLRLGYARIAEAFVPGDNTVSTALSHMKRLRQYHPIEYELVMFLILFCLFPVSYLNDPIEDMSSRVRNHLQSMGMTHLAYWANTFLLHWIQYTVCFAISVALLCIWDKYSNAYFLQVCIPTFFLGTASNQLTVYIAATLTKTKNTAVSLLCNFIALLLPSMFILSCRLSQLAPTMLIWLLPPVPPIAIVYFSALYALYSVEYFQVDSVAQLPHLSSSCWSSGFVQQSLMAMPIHIVVMCCIMVASEHSSSIRAALTRKKPPVKPDKAASTGDPAAQREAERVLQSVRNPQNVLEVRQLVKTYPNGVRAVRGVTFGAMAGEIFGLLGANGAGKSTSMSVIVGEEAATFGECEIRVKSGSWVSGGASASVGAVGYCPQHNPLFSCITVAEHLSLYAGIRGLASEAAERQAAALISGLGLQPHRDKQAGQLSGGNRRRLCLAIALLGDPALIVIDEASTGVDPENKRFIWSAIRAIVHEQRSVIVTTHSMEEVEALCSRVGIMNLGQMIAFGTVQQLRSLHGDAFTLEVLLKQQDKDQKAIKRKTALKNAVASHFSGAVVLDELSQSIQFYVPKASVTLLSDALQWLSGNQDSLGMDYYSFYQMSLDQVFVKLVKKHCSVKSGTV